MPYQREQFARARCSFAEAHVLWRLCGCNNSAGSASKPLHRVFVQVVTTPDTVVKCTSMQHPRKVINTDSVSPRCQRTDWRAAHKAECRLIKVCEQSYTLRLQA